MPGPSKATDSSGRWLGRPIQVGVLLLLAGGVYGNSLGSPFAFDDWHVIQQNPAVQSLDDIPRFFSDPALFSILPGNRDYRPVFLTSMALSWWADDGSPLPFHAVSIWLHIANTLLLFGLVRRTCLAAGGLRPAFDDADADRAALAAGGLFAVHPLATESINYISSQSVPLAAFFFLLGFSFFVYAYSPLPSSARSRALWAKAAAWLSYFLALLSKPIAITLPVVLLVWAILLAPPAPETAHAPPWRRATRRLLPLVPFAIITLAYLIIRSLLFDDAVGRRNDVPYLLHALTQTRALVFYYLGGAVLPVALNVDREYERTTTWLDGEALAAVAVVMLLAALLVRLRAQRTVVFWALWFPICLLVTTYLTKLGQTVNEHRVYLSLAGFCALVGIGLAWLRCALPLHLGDSTLGRRSGRRLLAGLLIATLATFATMTWARNAVWSSELALWETAALDRGTYRAHMNYARALDGAGRSKEALVEFERAVEMGSFAYPHMNLGLAYLRRNQQDLGLSHLQTATQLWPQSPETHYFYAYGLERAGDLSAAERELGLALTHRAVYPAAQRALERVRATRAGSGDPIERYAILLEQQPERAAELLFELAYSLQIEGRSDDAIAQYEALLQEDPDHRQGTFNLAYEYLQRDDVPDLERSALLFRRVLELDSTYAETWFRLASAYWKLGRADEALEADREYVRVGDHVDLRRRSVARIADATPAPPEPRAEPSAPS